MPVATYRPLKEIQVTGVGKIAIKTHESQADDTFIVTYDGAKLIRNRVYEILEIESVQDTCSIVISIPENFEENIIFALPETFVVEAKTKGGLYLTFKPAVGQDVDKGQKFKGSNNNNYNNRDSNNSNVNNNHW